jgi:hypothetical protein
MKKKEQKQKKKQRKKKEKKKSTVSHKLCLISAMNDDVCYAEVHTAQTQ